MIPGLPSVAVLGTRNRYAATGVVVLSISSVNERAFGGDFSDDFDKSGRVNRAAKAVRPTGAMGISLVISGEVDGYYPGEGGFTLSLGITGESKVARRPVGSAGLSVTITGASRVKVHGTGVVALGLTSVGAARARKVAAGASSVSLTMAGAARRVARPSSEPLTLRVQSFGASNAGLNGTGQSTISLSITGVSASTTPRDFNDDFSSDFG